MPEVARWPNMAPKMAPRWPKMVPRCPGKPDAPLFWQDNNQTGTASGLAWLTKCPQDGPICPKMAPRWLRVGPARLQDGSRLAQLDSKMAPRREPDLLLGWILL